MRKKVLSILLVLTMVLTLTPTVAFAATYGDTNGHWAESSIDRWSNAGVVHGTGAGEFNPNGDMSRAEAAQIFANLLRLKETTSISGYSDVDASAWYVDAVSKCVAAGILNGTGGNTMSPGMTVTREQTFVMIARALGVEDQPSSSKTFADAGSVSSWAVGSVNALVNLGVIQGIDASNIGPKVDINRASVMTVMDRLIGTYANTDGEWPIASKGITLVVAEDVSLTGTATDLPVVLAGDTAKVDMSNVTGAAKVVVQADTVDVTGAPEGTEFVTENAGNVTVNGEEVDNGQDYVVPEKEPEPEKKPSNPRPVTPSDNKTKLNVTYSVNMLADTKNNGPTVTVEDIPVDFKTDNTAKTVQGEFNKGSDLTFHVAIDDPDQVNGDENLTHYRIKTITATYKDNVNTLTLTGFGGKYTIEKPTKDVEVKINVDTSLCVEANSITIKDTNKTKPETDRWYPYPEYKENSIEPTGYGDQITTDNTEPNVKHVTYSVTDDKQNELEGEIEKRIETTYAWKDDEVWFAVKLNDPNPEEHSEDTTETYGIRNIYVTDEAESEIKLTGEEGIYYFIMPEKDVTVHIVLSATPDENCKFNPAGNCSYPKYNCTYDNTGENAESYGSGTKVEGEPKRTEGVKSYSSGIM